MITLINPNLVVQRDDIFTTGIVYLPISLAYFASSLKNNGFDCNVIDAFGEKPDQCWIEGNFIFRGLKPSEIMDKVHNNSTAIVIYAGNLTNHNALIQIIRALKVHFIKIPIIVMENTQAVTGYSIRRVQESFYDIGVDFIISGETEERGIALIRNLQCERTMDDILSVDGIGFRRNGKTFYIPPKNEITDPDKICFPAWELFPLQNYWHMKYAHGPFEADKYLPILTSRGCPYTCKFCVIPEMNQGKWRGRSAKNVVDEMEEYLIKFGVHEFHIEDVNPTVSDKRTREICEEILSRKLTIIWKVCAGPKIETIKDEKTLEIMAKAGCNYISISPESGSSRILNMIGKSFDLDHAMRMVKKMNTIGIYSQACFVLVSCF